MRLRERIRACQRASATLEPDSNARRSMGAQVVDHADEFLAGLPGGKTWIEDDGKGFPGIDRPFSESPGNFDDEFDFFIKEVEGQGINAASGGHIGYIPGGGLYASALADFLVAVNNRYAGVAFAAPGSVRMEHSLIRWMMGLVGYPDSAAGDLCSGGSIGNLSGIVSAREAHGLRGADLERVTVYLSPQTHHCVDKALRIAGLGEVIVRRVDLDERYRLRPESLAAQIASDRAAGLLPWLVVASAGTTDTGAVDPLRDLATVAHDNGLWLHVDAAYGGFFALTEDGRRILAGMEDSDSIVMDPHKGLFLPYGSGAVLVKDGAVMRRAHSYSADYLQDAFDGAVMASPADLSPEFTRHCRGPRMWMALRLAGVAAFRAALDEKLLLARYFHERISDMEGFQVGPEPDLSVVIYRYVPEQGDADDFNRRLVEAIRADGRILISSTQVDGAYTLRAAILCHRTHLDEIDLALELLAHHSQRIAREG